MKALCIHAHFDDFELVCAGLFEQWRRKLGDRFEGKHVVCTDGSTAHHEHTHQEIARIRYSEQEESSRISGVDFELLRRPDGTPFRESSLQISTDLMGALWKVIRDFEPDYLFCPPVVADPLAGIHNDHQTVAEAVRRVAYFINVPLAYSFEYPPETPKHEPCKVPVILNLYDLYMFGENAFDIVVDIESAFTKKCEMAWCHQSQITEWLPWVGRHDIAVPANLEEWISNRRRHADKMKNELSIITPGAVEVFTVTAWGIIPEYEQILEDFPDVLKNVSNLDHLKAKLERWK